MLFLSFFILSNPLMRNLNTLSVDPSYIDFMVNLFYYAKIAFLPDLRYTKIQNISLFV
jgi:hypothetical protein